MYKPLVSYCIFSYQQEDYIKQTIHGALNQTFSPLEIIISDDCSSDATFSVIQETVRDYKGPHKIILNRNENNLGIGAHFSKVVYDLANGEYLITIGGDDISKKNHVASSVIYFEQYPDAIMIDFNADFIDQQGNAINNNITNNTDWQFKRFTINDFINNNKISWFAPGRIIKKEMFTFFPALSPYCPTEDSIVVFRSLLLGGFIKINDKLLFYRRHSNNVSSIANLSRLSNSQIISQQLSDLIHSYQNKKISDSQFDSILNRLVLELKIRKLRYRLHKNYLSSIYSKLYQKGISFIFKYVV